LGEEIGDLYMEAGVQHEALGDTEARVSGLSFVDELPGTIAFLSAGVAVNLIPNKLSLVLDAGYAKGDAAEEFTATGALRVMY
jgi:outer membrane autotransporter protein